MMTKQMTKNDNDDKAHPASKTETSSEAQETKTRKNTNPDKNETHTKEIPDQTSNKSSPKAHEERRKSGGTNRRH